MIQIKSLAGRNLFEGDFSSVAKAVEAAVAAKTDLSGSDLSGSDLSYSDLRASDLSRSDLSRSNLSGAKNSDQAIACTRILPEGNLIGWKKARDGAIVRLLIPADAKRSHAFGRKCRAEFVRVLEIFRDGKASVEPAFSSYAVNKEYKLNEVVHCHEWCDDFTQECAGGIHFFITRLEAENYTL